MFKMWLIISIVGWIGLAFILIAYLLVTTKQFTPTSRIYQTLNLLGAIGIVIHSIASNAWPSAVLFIVWGALALIYLIISFKR